MATAVRHVHLLIRFGCFVTAVQSRGPDMSVRSAPSCNHLVGFILWQRQGEQPREAPVLPETPYQHQWGGCKKKTDHQYLQLAIKILYLIYKFIIEIWRIYITRANSGLSELDTRLLLEDECMHLYSISITYFTRCVNHWHKCIFWYINGI